MPAGYAAAPHLGLTFSLSFPDLQLTYPLDMLRFRIAVDPSCRTIGGAVAVLLKEGSGGAFYRGLGASLLGTCWRASLLDREWGAGVQHRGSVGLPAAWLRVAGRRVALWHLKAGAGPWQAACGLWLTE